MAPVPKGGSGLVGIEIPLQGEMGQQSRFAGKSVFYTGNDESINEPFEPPSGREKAVIIDLP